MEFSEFLDHNEPAGANAESEELKSNQ